MDRKMKPASQSIPSLMSVNVEPPKVTKSKNGLINLNYSNGQKLTSCKVTFPDKISIERNLSNVVAKKNNLSNLFSKFDHERSLKGAKRKNLFGSALEDNSVQETCTHSKAIKNCADLSKKFKKFHDLPKIDENNQHQIVANGIDYLGKFNRHSITSSIIEKIDKKFKQIAFSDDLIKNSQSISDSLCLSHKHNSKLVFQRCKNYHLNNSVKNKSEKPNGYSVNSLNIFEENSEIVDSIMPELNNLMSKNARLDECQNFFDFDLDKILISTNDLPNKKAEQQAEKLCHQIETDIRYQHYIIQTVDLILKSIQKIYNLNLQQIKYLLANYQTRLVVKNLSVKSELFLKDQCNILNKKLNYLIEDYEKLNFNSVSQIDNMFNLGSLIYKHLMGQLNQHLCKNEPKSFNYIKEIIDNYEIIKVEYEKFCTY